MAQMSCAYICSMIPRGLISCSKASRKASNSSADSVMSNGNFGRSANSFLRISHSSELTRGRGVGVGDANVLLDATNHSRAITDLRSEPPRTQLSSSAAVDVQTMGNRDLPPPVPGEGRDPVAQPLPHRRRRLSHRLEGPNRLRCLAP